MAQRVIHYNEITYDFDPFAVGDVRGIAITMVETFTHDNITIIKLRPNRSATWAQTKFLMLSFAVFVSSIATAWAFVGAWVVLPFAGAEVLALVAVMYLVSHATYQWQSIELTESTIKVDSSKRATVTFTRDATHLYFFEDTSHGRLPRLVLKTSSHMYEIGDFLNETDKAQLLKALQSNGVVVCKNKWW